MNRIPLSSGAFPAVLLALGVLSLLWLVLGGRRHLRLVLPAAVLAAGALTVLLYVLGEGLFHWWDASFPRFLYVYAYLGILALLLAVPRLTAAGGTWSRLLTLTASALAVLAVAGAVNSAYGQYPTLGSLLAPPSTQAGDLPQRDPAAAAGQPASTDANWNAPADLPARGSVYQAQIPGPVSGYASNPALIYLPPAYLADPPATNLPVLVLIHGQPGSPTDWLVGGQLADVMDNFAAAHQGLAPVVVMPDASNASNANWPLCLDSNISSSATYLAVDLPAWVREHLASGLDGGSQWAVAGYSYGGTCAMQLAVNFPAAYPSFIDIAGEAEPTVPQGRKSLIDTYFGGDADAFTRQNALDRLAAPDAGPFEGSAGIVVVGAGDSVYAPAGKRVYEAMQAAGIDVQLQSLHGGHSWEVWKAGLANNLDWLGRRLGILAS